MKHKNDMLELYKKADSYERLCLYLQHRDLRNDFLEIEGNEYSPDPKNDWKNVTLFEIFGTIYKQTLHRRGTTCIIRFVKRLKSITGTSNI